jgi:radical SAM superfamily enzyme YgiQ (UPF0313 family)
VAEEVKQLCESGVSIINIYDDCFILDLKRAERIKDLVKDYPVQFGVAARANLVTEEAAAILKEMHVTDVGIGFESNSPRILEYLQKGNTPEDNQRAVSTLRRYGITVHGSFIRDVPIETRDDLKLTYNFIRRNDIPYDMYRLMRFPNTLLYEGSRDWDSCKVKCYVPAKTRMRKRLADIKPLALAYHVVRRNDKAPEINEQ